MIVKLSNIGARGLVVFLGAGVADPYQYVEEGDWRALAAAPNPLPQEATELAKLHAVVAPLSADSLGHSRDVFVNFDEMPTLARTKLQPKAQGQTTAPSQAQWGRLIVHENGNFYGIESSLFSPLDAGSLGDTFVLVRRGAIAAAIPRNNIPSGSFCVLVNLPAIGH